MTLADYLKDATLNDAQFARQIGVPRQYVQRYRNGTMPSPDLIRRIYEATEGKVTANDFVGLAA